MVAGPAPRWPRDVKIPDGKVTPGQRRAGQPMTSSRGRRTGHPHRQPDLPLRHAAGLKHRDSDPVRFNLTSGSLGDTRKVMPASHHWEMLNRTALGQLGPGSTRLLRCAGRALCPVRTPAKVDILTIGGKLLRSPGTGPPGRGMKARRGPGRPVDNGEPHPLPAGRTPVRRDDRALSCGHVFPPASPGRPGVPFPAAVRRYPLCAQEDRVPCGIVQGEGRAGRSGSREGRGM
jgi:hypothetical protein